MKMINEKLAQMKIQQMAFVLLAIVIFFAMAGLFYFSLRYNNIKEGAVELRENEARELVRKFAGVPEFSWTATDCADCIDFDKVLVLKDRKTYEDFWNLDYLQIKKVYPINSTALNKSDVECNKGNYPDCDSITIIKKSSEVNAVSAFVALCRYDIAGYTKCELGKIIAGGERL